MSASERARIGRLDLLRTGQAAGRETLSADEALTVTGSQEESDGGTAALPDDTGSAGEVARLALGEGHPFIAERERQTAPVPGLLATQTHQVLL